MSNFIDDFGLDKEVVEKVEAQEVNAGYAPVTSGVYKGTITEFASFKSSGGAGMLKVEFKPADDKISPVTIYQNIKKKDGSANEIGQATVRHIADALGKELADLSSKSQKIKAYGKEVDATVVTNIENIQISAFIRQVFEEGAKFDSYNEIEAYGRADGTNSKGEDLVAAFKEKIDKTPILNRKAKAGAANTSTQATTTASGESVDSML